MSDKELKILAQKCYGPGKMPPSYYYGFKAAWELKNKSDEKDS